jgi:D-ribose pyranase
MGGTSQGAGRPRASHAALKIQDRFEALSWPSAAYGARGMLKSGLLNPHLLSLLARVRHTNALVIADRGFPSWPGLETVDISLVDGVPTVLQVLAAIRPNFVLGGAYMAEEFLRANSPATRKAFASALKGVTVTHEPHIDLKRRVPGAIGLIRTGDTVQYANLVLVSG